jgi:hypothetical protein
MEAGMLLSKWDATPVTSFTKKGQREILKPIFI